MTTTMTDVMEREMIEQGNEMMLRYARQQAVEAASDLVKYLRWRADDIERDMARAKGTDGKNEHGTSEADLWTWIHDAAGAPVSNTNALRNLEIAARDIRVALAVRRTLEHLGRPNA